MSRRVVVVAVVVILVTHWENKLAEPRFRGWRAVSTVGLQGKGLHERSVFFTDTGITLA